MMSVFNFLRILFSQRTFILSSCFGLLSLFANPNQMRAESIEEIDGVSTAITEDQSTFDWKYNHTPFKYRIGISAGDHAGGPIRFNSQFPEVKANPHPASYYHATSFAGVEFEKAMTTGGLLISMLKRKDFAHRGINGRSIAVNNEIWTVENFEYSGNALFIGWTLGSRFREAIWSIDLGFIYDRDSIDFSVIKSTFETRAIGQMNIEALSFRSRLHGGPVSSNPFQISLGPEIHVPVWQRISNRSDPDLKSFVDNSLDLKASAAIGLGLLTSYRF